MSVSHIFFQCLGNVPKERKARGLRGPLFLSVSMIVSTVDRYFNIYNLFWQCCYSCGNAVTVVQHVQQQQKTKTK